LTSKRPLELGTVQHISLNDRYAASEFFEPLGSADKCGHLVTGVYRLPDDL
jgi:hypothetical protein